MSGRRKKPRNDNVAREYNICSDSLLALVPLQMAISLSIAPQAESRFVLYVNKSLRHALTHLEVPCSSEPTYRPPVVVHRTARQLA